MPLALVSALHQTGFSSLAPQTAARSPHLTPSCSSEAPVLPLDAVTAAALPALDAASPRQPGVPMLEDVFLDMGGP